MSKRGKFITIEGQDGAGKTTNIQHINGFLQNNNIDVVLTREPGGTELGEQLRQLLLSQQQYKVADYAELLMIFAARAQHIEQLVSPALEQGKWVLCDRFTDATYAYQGGGRELPVEEIQYLEQMVQKDLRPDLTILLDLPVNIGEQRAGERSEPDRFEIEKQQFKQKVREYYLSIAKSQSDRVKLVDASQSIDAVKSQIDTVLNEFMKDV